ncbi:MAG: M23 family metallopeptidase [Clostridia bacterium]|nr:M23 family metallopeptidase [Clostridia bacterium]
MKKIIYVIIAILLIIPTIVAIKSYNDAKNAPADARTITSVTIIDMNGDKYVLEKKEDDDVAARMIQFFLETNANATEIVGLPETVVGTDFYSVTLSTPVKGDTYQYYFSTDATLCYAVTPEGDTLQLAPGNAGAFLESTYAESVYGTTQPVMTVSGEFTPAPYTAVWNFKANSGAFAEADTSRYTSDEAYEFDISGGLSVGFDLVPDLCNVKVTDTDGTVLLEDTSDKLADVRVEKETKVTVEVRAKWYEDAQRSYFGERAYKFDAKLTPAASFSVLKTSVDAGKFISVAVKNAPDLSKLSFTSEPDLKTTAPVFFNEGEYAYAFLAIPNDASGDYKLNFSYGGTTQEIALKVNPLEFYTGGYAEIPASDDMIATCFSETALAELDTLAESLVSKTSGTRLYNGYFDGYLAEAGSGATIVRGYGANVHLNGNPATTYSNSGVDFLIYEGGSVTAMNAGTVVYAGETAFTGKVVVIEHGYGLKTWYWNLGEVSVKEGDTVALGDTVGTAGLTGLNSGLSGAHVAMSVGADFVCSYDSWADGDGGILMQGVYEIK